MVRGNPRSCPLNVKCLLNVKRLVFNVLQLVSLLVLPVLPACAVPRPTIKIALVAPFEGRFREVGYDAFPAMRLALREQIKAGGIGRYQVEFVAYYDDADPVLAERVAHDVVLDERVMAVIGHFRLDTTRAAAAVYVQGQLALVVPQVPADQLPSAPLIFPLAPTRERMSDALAECPAGSGDVVQVENLPTFKGTVNSDLLHLLPDFHSPAAPDLLGASIHGLCFAADAPLLRDLPAAAQALAGFQDVSGGLAPAPRSISAYDATRLLLRAIQADIDANGVPTRAGVARALRHIDYEGLLGHISFDQSNTWRSAPAWVYEYDASAVAHLVK